MAHELIEYVEEQRKKKLLLIHTVVEQGGRGAWEIGTTWGPPVISDTLVD
ncbi:hypothetical protein [Halorhabdus amylolytica]|nr:hypothetical protein [Halorhabdus amylolytica]